MRQSSLTFTGAVNYIYPIIRAKFRAAFLLLILTSVCSAQVEVTTTAAPPVTQSIYDIVAVGDIMLGRLVQHEMRLSGRSPWHLIADQFPASPVRLANFEASISGDQLPCLVKTDLCLQVSADYLKYLKQAGFTHLSIANNHSADLGAAGRELTTHSVQQQGMSVIDARRGLQFGEANGLKLALIALSLVADANGHADHIPSLTLKQQLQLARQLADKVIVSIHWGNEYQNWVSQQQREAALWLTEQGVDLILGHHPHVIQAPECVNGKAVWFSLGNHVFDQKYPTTHRGALAACRFSRSSDAIHCDAYQTERNGSSSVIQSLIPDSAQGGLSCESSKNKSPPSFYGAPAAGVGVGAAVSAGAGTDAGKYQLRLANQSDTQKPIADGLPLRKIEAIQLGKSDPAWLFLLELESTFDQQKALRPHVYSLRNQRLFPLWRGSALAYPIRDLSVQKEIDGVDGADFLCVLHEAKSHLGQIDLRENLGSDVDKTKPLILSYEWSKFGFKLDKKPSHQEHCQQLWSEADLKEMQ